MNPSRTALVMIDVQNDFCHPEGWAGRAGLDVSGMPALLSRLERLIEAARANGVHVAFVQLVGDETTDSAVWIGEDGQRANICRKGTWGVELMQLVPKPEEPIIAKPRYGAFHKTDLESILQGWGTDTIVFTGVSTNVCVESTVREAFMRDYRVVVASDCVAAYRKASHDATLETVSRNFGRVMPSEEIAAAWEATPARV
jgi:ureidoacrylate peracid hydrolase